MDEIFDVVDERDRVVGRAPRSEIHRRGLRHRAVHLLVFNQAGEVFLQKRSPAKDTSPGLWDSSVSGHVDVGESYGDCVLREGREEIGLELSGPPEDLFRLDACPGTGMEFVQAYRCFAEGPFDLDPGEISEGAWFSPRRVDQRISGDPGGFAPAFRLVWRRYRSPASLLGMDLGGSSVKAAVLDQWGEELWSRRREFAPGEDFAGLVGELAAEADSLSFPRLESCGLAAPGLAAGDARSIAHMPGRLEGLVGLDWSRRLERPVHVLNDAQAALAGEAWRGAARGLSHVVFLSLGTGVGGAAMVDGRILRGARGRAGHAGHMSLDPDGPADICRTPGSLEMAIGNCSLSQRSGGRFSATRDLIGAVRRGDAHASEVWRRSVLGLACGIVSLINLLDPQAVVVGGGVARAGDDLFPLLDRYLEEREWMVSRDRVPVLPARLGDMAGAFGAALSAFRARA